MSLATPDKIRSLQRKLYGKAKAEPDYRFYLLYDKICRADILEHAYALARDNAGAPGVDGIDFKQIEAAGVEKWLVGLREDSRLEDLPAPGRATGDDPEAGRRRTPARHSHDSGPGGADRRQTGAGADLRGGFRGQRPWLPTPAERGRCDQPSAPASSVGAYGRGGRRSVEVFRHDPAPGPDASGRPAHRRPSRAASDQDVARSAGRGTGRGRNAAHEERQERAARHASGRRRQPVAGQSLHEPVPETLAAQRTRRSVQSPCRRLRRRLRHPLPRSRGRSAGVDEGDDDQARAHAQRGRKLR